MNKDRRVFLKNTGMAIGGILALPGCFHKPAPYRFFTKEEAQCLIALCECIIPRDDAPGATDAGVIYYIDKQITGPFQKHQSTYRTGIKALQTVCTGKYGKPFEKLSEENQLIELELLENNQQSSVQWGDTAPSYFFNMVINHTMQGFYGPPRHGGNKNYLSYNMLGIGYPLIIGQNRYKNEK